MSDSKAVVPQNKIASLAIFASGNNPFTALSKEMDISTGAFLRFSGDTGKYTYKGSEVEYGTRFAFNVLATAKKGYICWKDGKVVEQIMIEIASSTPLPDESSLTDHGPYNEKAGDGWRQQLGCVVRDLEGGDQMDFNLSNKSGVNALGQLFAEFGNKAPFNLDSEGNPKLPIVEVSAVSFQPKGIPGKKWAPTLRIVDWKSEAELVALDPYGEDDENMVGEDYDNEPVDAVTKPAKGMRRG